MVLAPRAGGWDAGFTTQCTRVPAHMGPITAVPFEDTCGNLINLVQPAA
jgi:hypothetical protein